MLAAVLMVAACGGPSTEEKAEYREAVANFTPPFVMSRLDYGGVVERRFRRLDRDADDYLTRTEIDAAAGGSLRRDRRRQGRAHLERGMVAAGRLRASSTRQDANKDGTVTSDERERARAARELDLPTPAEEPATNGTAAAKSHPPRQGTGPRLPLPQRSMVAWPASLFFITNNPDVRYLGRVLGDVIRAYGGEKLYERTEAIRSASVERHRGTDGASPEPELGQMDLDETLDFVRGFMLFSMLANLAEDRQGIAAEEGADLAGAVKRLEQAGVAREEVLALLDQSARRSPRRRPRTRPRCGASR
ncbi:phosphoenolpyruvate carboxylase [Sphingomonas sp. MMS24-JH45]